MVERTDAKTSEFEAIRLEKLFLSSPQLLVEDLAQDLEWDPVRQLFRFPENRDRLVDVVNTHNRREIRLADSSKDSSFTLMQVLARPSNTGPWEYTISTSAWTIAESKEQMSVKPMSVSDRIKSPSIYERFMGPIAAYHHEFSYSFPTSDKQGPLLHDGAGFDTLSSSDRTDLEQYLLQQYGEISPYYLADKLPARIDGFATMKNFFTHLAKRDSSAPLFIPERSVKPQSGWAFESVKLGSIYNL